MSDKSHVTMEQHLCIVCGKPFDTGALLLDRKLRQKFEHATITGRGLCPDDKKKYEDGFIALVECDPSKTAVNGGHVRAEDAYRTGTIIHMKREVFNQIFNAKEVKAVAFIPPDVTEHIKSMMKKNETPN